MLRVAGFERDPYAVPGPQGNERLRHDFLAWHQKQAPVAGDCNQDQGNFEHSKRLTNTHMWASAKRQIAVVWQFAVEAPGVEALRLRIVFSDTVQHIRADGN